MSQAKLSILLAIVESKDGMVSPEYNRRILAMSRDLTKTDKEMLIRLLRKITYPDSRKTPGDRG